MSSLLEQAIIDAKLLKETARRNAEAALIEQYADKIKENMEELLEQDDLGLDMPSDLDGESSPDVPPMEAEPVSAVPVAKPTPEIKKIMDKIPASFLGEDNLQEVEINLDSIIEKIDSLEKDLNMKAPDFTSPAHVTAHSNVEQVPSGGLEESLEEECLEEGGCQGEEEEEEEENLEESESLDEELIVDLENVSPGGINANEIELRKQYNVIKALEAQNEEINEELSAKYAELERMENKLESTLSRLKETRTKLTKSIELNGTLKEGFQLLTKKINDVNVLNSRLLYTNKILGNSSLNERQKKQIAESISKAKTVEEAKTIYETLQKSADVVTESRTAPKSLTEAINRAPSAFLPRVNTSVDPNVDRWQRIAGIKK